MAAYQDMHQLSINDPDTFWSEAAKGIYWHKRWESVCSEPEGEDPGYRWFKGGKLNTCYNAVDRHVKEGRGEQNAIIYDSPVTGQVQHYTYNQLLDEVSRLAGLIRDQGVGKGDRVIIYMPMIPQAVFAMLACARLGTVHSVVFGGFAGKELATRVDDAKAKLILAASCGIEPTRIVPYMPMVNEALELANHQPEAGVLIWQREQHPCDLVEGRDKDWKSLVQTVVPAPCTIVEATDPLYILYTSGTTGTPKGIVRDNGGHAVAMNWSMKNIYDVEPGDVYWAASDVGWVVGHSYICYAPLIYGCTTIVFEGKPVGTPDAGTFWRVIADHKVKVMFTAPTAIRAIKQQDPDGALLKNYDLSNLTGQFLAGERCDPDTLRWLEKHLGVPVIDHWWQTETGWQIAGICKGIESLPTKEGSANLPGPGWQIVALDADGKEVAPGEVGNICAKLPMSPSSFPTIWGNAKRYREAYMDPFPGYYMTGDAGYIDEDGYIFIMARTDDIINVAGHRLSTGQMEEVLSDHPLVAECAVFGVEDELKGQLPLGLLVLNSGADDKADQVVKEVIQSVRSVIGPVAAFKLAVVVKRLPKTRSGKILRGIMRKIADGQPYTPPGTIDDLTILDEISDALKTIGYAKA